MTASQGREGRGGRPWIATALAASGLVLAVSGTRPARACHIHHDKPTTTTSATTPTIAAHSATASTAMTPAQSQGFQQALQAFLKDWHEKTMPQAPTPTTTVTPTATAIPTPTATVHPTVRTPAAQTLTPTPSTSPTVQNWHQTTSASCTPPPPPCTCSSSTTTAIHDTFPPEPPKPPSAALQTTSATPAPEPSTILSALALVGAFAWRRRATRSRA